MIQRIFVILLLPLFLVSATVSAQPEPNDPLYSDQWALQTLRATCAWGYTLGSSEVTVAVIDSGVDLGHPDLVDRLRSDGADFIDNDNDPSDQHGHGTNVAGVVAATINNAEGIAGLAPGIAILPIRVMDARGFGPDQAIADGIRYAADRGAQVINLSLGATLSIGVEEESLIVSEAIRYAQGQGALVVVAAGNDFIDLPNAIVGDNPDVLVVAATDERDLKAPFSNFGEQVNIAAPGIFILSTMPTYEVYLTSDALPPDERFQQDYDFMSGTSQATPFVSALAALIFSANPDWDAQQVAQSIRENAIDISNLSPRPEQQQLGDGRIDACASLGGEVAEPDELPPGAPSRSSGGSSTPALVIGTLSLLLICLFVVVLGILVLVFRRVTRKPQPAAVSGVPYTPPPVAQPPVTPPSQTVPAAGGTAQPTPWGTLVVISGPTPSQSFPLIGSEVVIGRSPESTIVLQNDATMSRRHAVIRNNGQAVTLEDAMSTHGTYLNGQRVTAPVSVRRGDVMQVGQTSLRFD
ncbi:MAG: S8 family serine peptidase [Chloroflexota bacterium]